MSRPSTRNIYIIGAQCTGKTTLVDALERSLSGEVLGGSHVPRPVIVKEVARSVLQSHSFTASDIVSGTDRCLQLQSLILEAQSDSEREALKQSWWLISDRSGLDPIIYARRHAGAAAANALLSTEHWRELQGRMSASLIVLCEPRADLLVDDGVRLMPRDLQDWRLCHEEFCQTLERLGLRYHVIASSVLSLEERVRVVLSEWRRG